MEEKKLFWSLYYGSRKGVIFTLDIVIAMMILIMGLAVSGGLVLKSLDNDLDFLQASLIGSDIAFVLEEKKVFDGLDKGFINNNINSLLLDGFEMDYRVECDTIVMQDTNLPNRFVVTGERVIVTNDLDYCIFRYWVWPK